MVAWPLSEVQILLQLGRDREADEVGRAFLPVPGAHPLADMTRALLLARQGAGDAARALLTADLESRLWPDLQYAYFVAQVYVALGDLETGLRWLTQSTRRGFIHQPYLSERDPLLAPLRKRQGFKDLMARVDSQRVALTPR